jgi:TIR domain
MDILLISAESDVATANLQAALADAGHVVVRDQESDTPDAAVVLISGSSEPDAISNASREAESIRQIGRPTIGVTLTPTRDLPGANTAVPHDGAWTEVSPDGPNAYAALLDDLRRLPAPGRVARVPRQVEAATVEREQDQHETVAPGLFISYSSRDAKLVDDVCNWLQERQFDFWRDTSLQGGAIWRDGIAQAIRRYDIFVLLLSPNVVKYPSRVTEELQLAQSYGKRILPVYLLKTSVLPQGSELILSPLQAIRLFPDFNAGLDALAMAIGAAPASSRSEGLRDRARRAGREARRFARQRDLGSKAKKYGSTAVAGVVLGAVAVSKVVADREAAQRAAERKEYVARTLSLLESAMEHVRERGEIRPELYQKQFVEVFRPDMMRILGALEATPPDSPSLREWHERLVKNLERVVRQLEDAIDRLERGEQVEHEYSIKRLNDAWADTVKSSLLWLQQALDDPSAN